MDKEAERELRKDVKEMRQEMNDGFKELSVQLATVTTKQNIGGWFFQLLVMVSVSGISGFIASHLSK